MKKGGNFTEPKSMGVVGDLRHMTNYTASSHENLEYHQVRDRE